MNTWATDNPKVGYSNEWQLADNLHRGAQCIDLVRFVNSVIGVLGSAGTARAVVVWAHPDRPQVPVVSDWPDGGLGTSHAVPPDPSWWPGLMDGNDCLNNYDVQRVAGTYPGRRCATGRVTCTP